MPSRLPRFKRSTSVPPIAVTDRDRAIIRMIHRHRFLRSSHIISLSGGSPQQVVRRLQLLYHHGFLERPRSQLDFYYRPGSREIVYGLGDKGATMLRQAGISCPASRWGEKNRSTGRAQLEHRLMVADVMVAMELACRKSGVRLVTSDQLTTSEQKSFRWRVFVNGEKLGVIPDGVFALDYTDADGKEERAYFFLEADRGTMPVMRKSLSQTSMYRKFLAYEATWSQGIHRSHFGFHRFRVLTVTTGQVRIDSLAEACRDLKSGHGLFLFADLSTVTGNPNLFSLHWQSGREGQAPPLFP